MILRFVKMTFNADKTGDFETIFSKTQPEILKFNGCRSVEVFTEAQQPHIYFTVSRWDSEEDLNRYRHSDFFRITWAKVKPMFTEKAEAWSLTEPGK